MPHVRANALVVLAANDRWELERQCERQRLGLEPLPAEDGGGTFDELMKWSTRLVAVCHAQQRRGRSTPSLPLPEEQCTPQLLSCRRRFSWGGLGERYRVRDDAPRWVGWNRRRDRQGRAQADELQPAAASFELAKRLSTMPKHAARSRSTFQGF